MDTFQNKDVENIFNNYPGEMREKLLFLRSLVLETVEETDGINTIEETLKWGEPSYIAKGGSTIRMNWKKSAPDHYAMYFNCKTKLVDTFRERYKHEFKYEGNRAIVFHKNDDIPVEELKHCILLSLTYHRVKDLPMLGV